MNEFVSTDVVVMDVIKTIIQGMITKEFCDVQFDVGVRFDYLLNSFKVQITNFFVGKKQAKFNLVYYAPKNWKDAFKLQHKEKWWMKRWLKKHPIKYKPFKIETTKFTYFPDFKIPHNLKGKRKVEFIQQRFVSYE